MSAVDAAKRRARQSGSGSGAGLPRRDGAIRCHPRATGARRPGGGAARAARGRAKGADALLAAFRERVGKPPVTLGSRGGKAGEATVGKGEGLATRYADAGHEKENLDMNARAAEDKGFYFQQRHGFVDVRSIARVDLDRVVQDVDVETLQLHLENLTFGELDCRDLRSFTDENFAKLFRMTQLTIEYLLNVQHTLYVYAARIEEQLAAIQDEHQVAELKLKDQDSQLTHLADEIKQKKRTLKTYEFLLTQSANTSHYSSSSQKDDVAHGGLEEQKKSREDDASNAMRAAEEMAAANRIQAQEEAFAHRQSELKEQAEQMKRILKEEAEAMKLQVKQELEAQRNAFTMREEALNLAEEELRAKIDKLALNENTQTRSVRRHSFAGSVIEDDGAIDANVMSQVDEILQSTGSLDNLREELAHVVNENGHLHKEIATLTDKLYRIDHMQETSAFPTSTRSALAEQEPEVGKATDQSLENAKQALLRAEAERDRLAAQAELERKEKQRLLEEMQSSKSKALATARATQLRRIIRLVRRHFLTAGYSSWKIKTASLACSSAQDASRTIQQLSPASVESMPVVHGQFTPSSKLQEALNWEEYDAPKWSHSEQEIQQEAAELSMELSRSLEHFKSSYTLGSIGQPTPMSVHSSKTVHTPGTDGSLPALGVGQSTPDQHSVPVNFGDDDSFSSSHRTFKQGEESRDLQSSKSAAPYAGSDTSMDQSLEGPLQVVLPQGKSPMSRQKLMRRHQKAMSRFSKVGLIRRAQVNTLNLSEDSGSSRTATSVSTAYRNESIDSLARTNQSHFDVMQRADQYERSYSPGPTPGGPPPSASTGQSPGRSMMAINTTADSDGSSLHEVKNLAPLGTERPNAFKVMKNDSSAQKNNFSGQAPTESRHISNLLDEIEDDDSD